MNTLLLQVHPQDGQLLADSPCLPEKIPMLALEYDGRALDIKRILDQEDGFHLFFAIDQGEIEVIVSLSGTEDQASLHVSMWGPNAQCRLNLPFLSALTLGSDTRFIDLYTLADRLDRPILRHRDLHAPWVATDGTRSLILLSKNGHLPGTGLPIQLGETPREVYSANLLLRQGGWREAFATIRTAMRAGLDLSEYSRADLQWYSDQFVQHFTFLFGKEILDLEQGKFELERFLDEGERDFGGYDGFLIWGVYPRIGVDERTQWEFYDDLPGGRTGLRAMSQRARQRGVRFFVPYKPWDRSAELHGQTTIPDEDLLAQLIVDTEADGVFLDTMDLITPEFRQAIDRRKPGVVFCSEGRTRGPAMEIVTGCWEQSPNRGQGDGNWSASPERMPQLDLWRFILPEHRLFVINRHSMGDDRIRILQRGFFNGMGWVIWQDIFGLTLPYTPEEAALLKKCRTIFRENRQALNSPEPTPLVETTRPGLWANEFLGASKRLWTLYNENDTPVTGSGLPLEPRPGCHFMDVWNGREALTAQTGGPSLEVGAHSTGCIVEYPRLFERSPDGQQLRVERLPAGAQVQVELASGVHRLNLQAGAWVHLPDGANRAVIKILQDGEVLDMLCITPEAA